jgi:hypothetical protein
MIFNLIFLGLMLVPIGVLCWRLIVSKTRAHWIRIGAAGAAMITAVGAFVVYDDLDDFHFKDWRADIALAAASIGSFYLIGWSQRHGNRRHRTVSIIGAIIGLVPVFAAIAFGILFGGAQG